MSRLVKKEITLLQYILAIHGTQVGTSILTLPAEVAKTAGTDGWISIIIGSILATIVSLCIVHLMANHPGDTMLKLMTRYLGKGLGKAMMVIWMLYSLFAITVILFVTISIIQIWILPNTSSYLIVTLLMINTYMIIRRGVRLIGRYAEFVFFFTLGLPILLIIPLKDSHWVYLLPILKEGWMPILSAVKTTTVAFLGFELAFLFYPYLKNKKAAAKGVVIANVLTLLVYLHITLSCFVYFSPDEITQFLWPTLTLVKPIEFPFLERMEIIFVAFYIFLFSTSSIPYLFFVTDTFSQLCNKKDWQLPYLLLPLFVVVFFFFKPSYKVLELWKEWWGWISYFTAYAFPVIFLFYVKGYTHWKRRKIDDKAG
ncbi:endospore germination permease [Aneurinibacillus thermoaerophilus]|uniref:GerAB/ArcD/ProY family transporter n=1 Tax=Aneurinibacillus thermoaerophilus TaxID=143495 RepID=UPI002E20FE2D|nr:endospore germination permease [Aneurinibacillus thermoaerophilus]MED0738135.1 endospore germination permease [Aneurinibacillus thermoaerophilus]